MTLTYITFVVFVLNSFYLAAQSQSIDQDGYVGCFVMNLFDREFNSYVSHLDSAKITTSLCKKSCSDLGYPLAAIENGNMCFCKSSLTINSANATDSACATIPCAGNTAIWCGSPTNLLVYMPALTSQVIFFLYEIKKKYYYYSFMNLKAHRCQFCFTSGSG